MSTATIEGRRNRKKAETRDALRQAALRLALRDGYEQLTVEHITRDADVSVRTFFNYFTSKDDALLGPDLESAHEVADELAARPEQESPVEALRAVLASLASSFVVRQQLWQSRMELVRASPELWPQLIAGFSERERVLTEAIAARTGTNASVDLYPGVLAAAVTGAARTALSHWQAEAGRPLADLLHDAFDILAAGFTLPDPGATR
jgi:AcrR family transcriptional regulator